MLAEPEAVERLTMNDKYFFGLLERMTAGALLLLLLVSMSGPTSCSITFLMWTS